MKNTLIGKMDAKSNKAIFMCKHYKAYRVFNKSSSIVEESMHVVFMRLMLLLER